MLHLRLSIALLLVGACLLTCSDLSGAQPCSNPILKALSTERVITCDDPNNVQRLQCDSGVILVLSTLYGRKDSQTCSDGKAPNQLMDTNCAQVGAVHVLRERCDGKKVCEFNTNVLHTSEPCCGISKYVDTTYVCFPGNHTVTCEDSSLNLSCDEGMVIYVYGADYGRRDQTTCSYKRPTFQLQNVLCSNPTGKVANRCNGKNSCTIRASNSEFGDPCVGTYKYLEVSYRCQYPVH